MGADIRRNGKVEKATEFIERMRGVQKEAGAALRKAQEEMRKSDAKYKRFSIQGKTSEEVDRECHKLHSACIFTTSGPIFTN